MENKKDRFEITELFMAQTSKSRRFFGTIKRETDSDGTPVIRGEITMQDGFLLAQADTQEKLGKKLDELVLMVLDYALHSGVGATSEIADMNCFLN